MTWQSTQTGDANLYGQRFNAGGDLVGGEFLVNQTQAGGQGEGHGSSIGGFENVGDATLDQLSNGTLVAVWQGDRNLDSFGRIFDFVI